jgi:hypothetical protein
MSAIVTGVPVSDRSAFFHKQRPTDHSARSWRGVGAELNERPELRGGQKLASGGFGGTQHRSEEPVEDEPGTRSRGGRQGGNRAGSNHLAFPKPVSQEQIRETHLGTGMGNGETGHAQSAETARLLLGSS